MPYQFMSGYCHPGIPSAFASPPIMPSSQGHVLALNGYLAALGCHKPKPAQTQAGGGCRLILGSRDRGTPQNEGLGPSGLHTSGSWQDVLSLPGRLALG